MTFRITPNVQIERDAQGIVRHLVHLHEPYTLPAGLAAPSPQALAGQYVRDVAGLYGVEQDALKDLSRQLTGRPTEEGTLLQFAEQKSVMESTVVAYAQTHMGLPIWEAGLSVTMHANPLRATSSLSTYHHAIKMEHVDPNDFQFEPEKLTPEMLAQLLGQPDAQPRINGTKLRIYHYDPAKRYDPEGMADRKPESPTRAPQNLPMHAHAPILQMPEINEAIVPHQHYIVIEALFSLEAEGWGMVNWRCFIEPMSGAVLYLRAFVAGATGAIYERDPMTATGNAMITASSSAATLDALRTVVALPGLTAPAPGEHQALTGEFVRLTNISDPSVAAPTEALPGNFNYSVPTDNFTAVNAYYHSDAVFRMVKDMGFNMATYFGGTSFPVRVDHRATIGGSCAGGNCVNAQAPGNATGTGSDGFRYALAAAGSTVGIATDYRVVLHEFGHAILWDSVHSPNFGFAHSAGDSLAAILCDPGSQAPDRFQTFPWILPLRRHDRAVGAGWGWGGASDTGSYNSEQILSTTMFRLYRSLGGDSTSLNLQKYAARWTAYLIIRAVGSLATSPITPTPNASIFATALMNADIGTMLFDGIGGGGAHKVIRWAFEKQGLYQPAGAPTPVTTQGAAPAVDVYIDDGRAGEYTYLPNHWSTTDIWNRLEADGGLEHQTPIVGVPNYVYTRIKNRGTTSATAIVVKGYHCRPSTGLRWPDDWQAMTTAQMSLPGALATGASTIAGPFEWTPETIGHECLLMAVNAAGDMANTETVAGPVPEWWLVRNDNNIAQRNVAPVAAGGGGLNLAASFKGRRFWANNPFDRSVQVRLDVVMPAFLRERKWEMQFANAGGAAFSLGARMDREIVLNMRPGQDFTAADVAAGAMIEVHAYIDDILTGGMSYYLDPKMNRPAPETPQADKPAPDCAGNARQFLDCVDLSESEVKRVKVRKVTIDIEMKDDGC